MMKQLLKYVAAALLAGMVFLEVYAEAPFGDMAADLLAVSTEPKLSDATSLPCPDTFVDPETEGPYYKAGSPERRDLITENSAGEKKGTFSFRLNQ